jgi:Family of unknown function (DUF5693)
MADSFVRRLALAAIIAGTLAALLIAWDRFRFEMLDRSVEITMDQQDLSDFAHAFGYNMDELLQQMRRAGLTSVAVYEEQGVRVNNANHALALSGQQLIDSGRVSPLGDPLLEAMWHAHRLDPNSMYLIVYDAPTLTRYLTVLPNQLEPRNVRVVRASLPAIVAVKTQIDFFNSLGLGIPDDIARQVRRAGLLVDPRVQNNERMGPARIDATFAQMLAGGRIGTVIFFGQGNEVLGYPFNLDATADAFRAADVNFGDVEAYSADQIQKGSITLARKIVNQTVRVQAISKIELDKLDLDTVIGRYLLGVRERNIRVIYLRPFPHVIQRPLADGTLVTESAEATNLEMLRRLRDGLAANGFSTGRAHGFVNFKSPNLEVLYCVVALGVVGAFLLLLDLYAWANAWMAWTSFGITLAAYVASALLAHDYIVRQIWALGGALTFALLAGTVAAPYFSSAGSHQADSFASSVTRGAVCMLRSAGVAILGGFFVAALLSQATFMIEVQQFLGTKVLLAGPPLILLILYAFTPVFGMRQRLGEVASSPLRAWQFFAILVLAAAAVLLLIRSGNQPDIGVSGFEQHLRGVLTTLVGARPRFKEFLVGYPALVLLPALTPAHRRTIGWLIILAAGIALSDVIDTFSHIHTPLLVTVLRIVNGLLFGLIAGIIVQLIYRRLFVRRSARA